VDGDRLRRHRRLRAAELVRAVVADNDVLQPQQQLGGERLAGQLLDTRRLLVEHLDADDQVPDQLALVAVAKRALVGQFAQFADIMEEEAHQEEVAVELRVQRRDAVGGIEQSDGVFQQPADVGVVDAHPGRGLAQPGRQVVVHQEALRQRAQVGAVELAQQLPQALEELADVLVGVRQEVGEIDLFRRDAVDLVQDHL
jgi:hypothetical protein